MLQTRLLYLSLLTAIQLPGSGIQAVEFLSGDIDLGLELRPSTFDFTLTNTQIAGNPSSSGEDSFDYGLGLRSSLLWGPSSPGRRWGWLIGGELTGNWSSYDSDADLYRFGLRALGGLGYSISDRIDTHILAYGGYGLSTMSIGANTIHSSISMDGDYVEYGARIGATYGLSRRWFLKADIGWTWNEADMDGDGFEIEIDESGLTAFLGLTFRIDPSPPRIE